MLVITLSGGLCIFWYVLIVKFVTRAEINSPIYIKDTMQRAKSLHWSCHCSRNLQTLFLIGGPK